ncbi:hypothetical protein [Kineothrix sedimenti]|uniref:Nucleoside 2-deoxyribosyltransferase-like protein n=1 Tax=Kineothrix sedimenti TaxID=3123317 RepID=A0ABZ3F0A6_9FIRM
MKKIYLCGACEQVSFEESQKWRVESEEWFEKNAEGFICINPNDYFEYDKSYHKTDSEVFRFLLRKVRESDVVLVNLDSIRQSVGSIVEIHEAFVNNIPVIGFYNRDKKLKNKDKKSLFHSWIYEMVDRIETGSHAHEWAMNYIKDYYGYC